MDAIRTFKAKFFDGHSIQAIEAEISILPDFLKITYEDKGIHYELHWPATSLQLMERHYRDKPALVGSKFMLGARVVVNQAEDYEAILQLISSKNIKLSHVHHPWRNMGIIIALIAIIIILPIWKIHVISAWAAKILPYQWEELFWKNMVEPDMLNLQECVAPEGKKVLDKLVKRLTDAAHLEHPLDVKVINSPKTINAQSLPGYHILIYSGLFEMNNPDAFAAVIAHEMGHSVYHHVIAHYLSNAGMAAFFGGVLGLPTNNFAFDFLNFKYNRDYEIQSDQYSIEILKNANIDPAGFGFAMKYLEKLGGDFKGFEPYLVEHPTFKERIDLVKSLPQNSEMKPCLTPEEWKDLKSICSKKVPIKFSASQ